MEATPEDHLHQAIKLAQQAAAQMKRAARLAENAALSWQQALALLNSEDLPRLTEPIQMSVTAPKRPRKQHLKPETTRLIEHTPIRNIPHLTPAPSASESADLAAKHGWEEGDDWWKPRQPEPAPES